MSSIIEGYSYDIFISYRQNDNKYDGWVTEFVDNLNKELEATIKDRINVYFDANPHDGLLETHLVSLSLEDKLRCLIFIPILSRTYCDPKSFAWNNEFLAFIKIAEQDRFGLNIKLDSGNFASRILPVRIHDLDPEDTKLVENQMGFIRSVDFIYHSQGVNRPLRQKDDDVIQNTKQLIYRDQINKAANAINEIIRGLKRIQAAPVEKQKDIITSSADVRSPEIKIPVTQGSTDKAPDSDERHPERPNKNKKKRIIYTSGSLVIFLALIALYIFSSGSTLPFSKRDWVLITDFENLTGDPVFDKSLYTAFSLSTSQSRYINVFTRSRMLETLARMEIKDKEFIDEKTGREMALREGIDICIVPSISEAGNKYAVAAKIIETKSGDLLRSEVLYAETQDEILPALDKLTRKLRRSLGESRYNIAGQDKPLAEVTTSSLEALKQFTQGYECHIMQDFTGAKKYYEIALQIDTGFTAAKAALGSINIERFDLEKGHELLNQSVRTVSKLTDRERLNILAIHALHFDNNIPKSIEYIRRLTELYPDDPVYHNNLGYNYQVSNKFEEALEEYKAAVKINPDLVVTYGGILFIYLEKLGRIDSAFIWTDKLISDNPNNAWGYYYRGLAYISIDSIGKAEAAFQKAREVDPYLILNLYNLAHTYRLQGRYQEAIRILEKIQEIDKNQNGANYDLGVNHQLMGNQQEARKYFSIYRKIVSEEWMEKWPDEAGTYITLASLTARLGDIDSSKRMLQKAIEMDSTLHTRFSEVLCVQGKIPEALDELEKALNSGYRELFWLKLNSDWQSLQYDIRFRNLLDKYFK